ncbi:L-ascorbate metabolism protein UlaG (beta-lactamase superfamily) [Aquimarina sp. MAR_2010_214]|uniref:MBL fold metallo-hydrolase n=1 Tax=Aquimarina sp. MAR_2010_214 TaxID=1250026 RepID=UPI000C715A53|nr:MBL fold metallo-hydrolase [Aquimarina sp. MAR_2010_214]PKV50321.1 L-ascorbate metabolism protein UlaG (beta-lactamase superfamily) [Aquimarina sp. MAR_2010_214]
MKNLNIDFKWIGASTWILKVGDLKIACDPILCDINTIIDLKFFKTKRRTKPQFVNSDFDAIDVWLLTHNHSDHIDELGMSKISSSSKVYSHKNLKPWFANRSLENVSFMNWTDKIHTNSNGYEIEIEAITCVHGSNYISSILCGGVNGYWIKIKKDGQSLEIYVTGDTINHSKMKKHIKERKADILIPNMGGGGLDKFGGPFSYTADLLKDTVTITRPSVILPVHHTSFSLFKEPIEELYKWNDDRIIEFGEGQTINLQEHIFKNNIGFTSKI